MICRANARAECLCDRGGEAEAAFPDAGAHGQPTLKGSPKEGDIRQGQAYDGNEAVKRGPGRIRFHSLFLTRGKTRAFFPGRKGVPGHKKI